MANNKKNKSKQKTGTSRRRFGIVLWVIFLAVSIIGIIFVTNNFKTEFLESFKYENRTAVETMVSNINQVYYEFESGAINESQAKEVATRMVQNGVWNNGQRGFWALEPDGTLVAKVENGDMTQKPGDNVWDYQDADGKYVERELIEVGQNGGGFVEFRVENHEVNNSYVGYALETKFGFVVDATFDMNYFNNYWNGSVMIAMARAIAVVVICFAVLIATWLYVKQFLS